MQTRTLVLGGMMLLIATAVCAAQEPAQPQEPPQDRKPQPKMNRAHGDRSEGMLQLLVRELNLDEAQQNQVRALLEEHRNREYELRTSNTIPPELQEKTAKVRQEMMRAREAGDADKLKELREELQSLQKEREAHLQPIKVKLDESQEQLHDQILSTLRDDQKARFLEVWDDQLTTPDAYGGPVRNPRVLKSQVDKLPDLSPEQKKQIDALFEQFRRTSRDPQSAGLKARKDLHRKLYDDVFALLTAEQREKVEKALEGKRHRPGMEHKRQMRGEQRGPAEKPAENGAPPPPTPVGR